MSQTRSINTHPIDPPRRADSGATPAVGAMNKGADYTFTPENVASLIASLEKSQTDALNNILRSVVQARTSIPNPTVELHGTMARCRATFSGAEDQSVEAFIDAVESYAECMKVADSNVVKGLSLLLVSQAGVWWQGIKNQISTWAEAKANLISAFGDRRPPHRIYKEIFSTPQAQEKIDIFVARIRALMARLPKGDISIRAQLDIIYGLLHIRIRKRLRREEFSSFMELLQHARNIEDSLHEGESAIATDSTNSSNLKITNHDPAVTADSASQLAAAKSQKPTAACESLANPVPGTPPLPVPDSDKQTVACTTSYCAVHVNCVKSSTSLPSKKRRPRCRYCRHFGHKRYQCRKLVKTKGESHVSVSCSANVITNNVKCKENFYSVELSRPHSKRCYYRKSSNCNLSALINNSPICNLSPSADACCQYKLFFRLYVTGLRVAVAITIKTHASSTT